MVCTMAKPPSMIASTNDTTSTALSSLVLIPDLRPLRKSCATKKIPSSSRKSRTSMRTSRQRAFSFMSSEVLNHLLIVRSAMIQMTSSTTTITVISTRDGSDTIRLSMKLLTKEILRKLPPLYSQEKLGGKAIAFVKFFSPDSSWTWWATEGSAEGNDFIFFGLVDGLEKELGYFCLSELQAVRGPMGLPVERDLHWKPKTLRQIAPELFDETDHPRPDPAPEHSGAS